MRKLSLLFTFAYAAMAASVSWALTPISVSNSTQALAYGSFVAGSGGSVIVAVNPLGRSASGGVFLVPSGIWSAGAFSVTGDPNLTYAITLPADGVVVLTSGANTMAVNGFISNPAPTGQLSLGGSQTLMVGATLSVSSNQVSGSYSGSYSVTVDYN
jgi:hypothetical protein